MKQNMVKLFNWQALLKVARWAACGLLPFAKVEASGEPKEHMAEFVRRILLQATGADWAIPLAGERFAFEAATGGVPPRSDASAYVTQFPRLLAFRKETPGLHAAGPEPTGQGTSATENLRALLSSKPIGWQSGQVQKPPMDAARIALLRQCTLEEFDDLDEYAAEMGHEPLSDTAKANAWKLVQRILDEYPDYYYVGPEVDGGVSICFSKCAKHYCTIVCEADGSASCIVTRHNKTSDKFYDSIDGLPDGYMREALAPHPKASSR